MRVEPERRRGAVPPSFDAAWTASPCRRSFQRAGDHSEIGHKIGEPAGGLF
jgi:hypothetical protein